MSLQRISRRAYAFLYPD